MKDLWECPVPIQRRSWFLHLGKGNVRKQSYSCGNASRSIPVLFDASTSVVTRGKLEMYNKAEKELPAGWALDAQGKPSKNAGEVLGNIVGKRGGGIVPLGGNEELTGSHKGYGYGMLCELFSSILSMGMTSNHTHVDGKGGTCHGFAAVNLEFFGNAEEIKKHLSVFWMN